MSDQEGGNRQFFQCQWPGVLSPQSTLVVAGGVCDTGKDTGAVYVEIFKADTSQWYMTDRLTTPCRDILTVVIGNTCCALLLRGSVIPQSNASVDDLLRNAVPAKQTTHSGSTDALSAWKTLANTPTYQFYPRKFVSEQNLAKPRNNMIILILILENFRLYGILCYTYERRGFCTLVLYVV